MNYLNRYISYLNGVWSQESKGFGDTFSKITKSFGIKPCGGCEERRRSWNEKLAYAKEKRDNG